MIGSIEVTLLVLCSDSILFGLHLSLDLPLNFTLHHLVLATGAGNLICRVPASAILSVVCRETLLLLLSVNPVLSVVEGLALNRVFKVEVALRNVRLGDRSKK